MTEQEIIKSCSCCKKDKVGSEFGKDKYAKTGLTHRCKACLSEARSRIRNIDIEKSRSDGRIKTQLYRANNPDKIKKHAKSSRERNKEKCAYRNKQWRAKNKDILEVKRKIYVSKNKEAIKKRMDKWLKSARKNNKNFILKQALGGRLRSALKYKGLRKYKRTTEILGADVNFIRKYIERQFKKGMTWENHGKYGWHLDHIIPLSSAKTEEELIRLCHFTNIQPLWWRDNLYKSNKMPQVQMKIAI